MENSIKRQGFMLMLSSPSGAGKTTLSRRLLAQDSDLCFSVSATTRPKRASEIDAKDYHFVDEAQFDSMRENDEFLEEANIFGHSYGTPAASVDPYLAAGKDVVFEIDWQGYRQLKVKRPSDVVSVFILPPSMAELSRRLEQRAQDSTEVVEKRMQQAAKDISHWREYDYVLVNNNLDVALSQLVQIIAAERLKNERQIELSDFVATLS